MDFLIHHMLKTSAARFPEKEALICENERLPYGEVARRSLTRSDLAASLRNSTCMRASGTKSSDRCWKR